MPPASPWRTRPVATHDRAAWLRMRCALWPEDPAEHAVEIDRFLAGQAEDLVAVFVCLGDDPEPVGFLELNIRNYAEGSASARVPYVEGWYVDAEHRRHGVGAALMAQAEAWARGQGFSELASDCELENNTSLAAHLALGFDETERVVCFLKQLVD